MAWRKESGVDVADVSGHGQHLEASHIPQLLLDFKLPELREVLRARPFAFHKCDKVGRPVFYDRAGWLSLPQLKEALYARAGDQWLATYVRYFIWSQEATLQYRLPACSLAAGRLVNTCVYVIDM